MTLIALALAVASLSHAGPDPYTEKQATERASLVVIGEAIDVSCQGWMEYDRDGEYEARYHTTVVIDEVIKGVGYSAGDEIIIAITEFVGDRGNMDCGWFDSLVYPGDISKFFLYDNSDQLFEMLEYAETIVIDDSAKGSLPDCEPTNDEPEEECPTEECPHEDITEIQDDGSEAAADEDDSESDSDPDTDTDTDTFDVSGDEINAPGSCQVVGNPTGLAALLPVLMAMFTFRRRF